MTFREIILSAEGGQSWAQLKLGQMYAQGYGVRRNLPEAVRWFREAASRGSIEAQVSLGVLYEDGRGVERDFTEAMRWYLAAAHSSDPMAQNNIGVLYFYGRGVERDLNEAERWLGLSAGQGYAEAQFNLALVVEEKRRGGDESLGWFRKAAEQGLALAQAALAFKYAHGAGVSQDYGEAFRWSRRAAEQGLPNAQALLGLLYAKGRGVGQDWKLAERWYREAAGQGNIHAQVNLGAMFYFEGRGPRRDVREAAKWFSLAAAQDDPVGMTNLGTMIEHGDGFIATDHEAAQFYTKAACLGYGPAQAKLARMYSDGRGVWPDPVEALKWMLLAESDGVEEAAQEASELRAGLPPAKIDEAYRRARAWRPLAPRDC